MKDLFSQRWFKPALFTLLLILQLAFLFTVAFFRPGWTEAESVSLSLARSPSVEAADASPAADSPFARVLDNCISRGVPPLYSLLLRWISDILPESTHTVGAPGFLNLALFALSWTILYFTARGLIHDPWDAVLVPLLYGFSAGAALTVRTCGPYMLSLFFASVLLYLLTALQRRSRVKLLYAGLFLTVLGGFLTIYEFLFLAPAAAAVFAVFCAVRRRWSAMATTLVTTVGALLTGVILYPACIEHFVGKAVPFTLSYPVRLSSLYTGLSKTLFGGSLTVFLILSALLAAAALFFRAAAPKKTTQPALARAERGAVTEDPEVQPSPTIDPAEAAYQRRIARRTDTSPNRRLTLSPFVSAYLLIGFVLILYFLLLPLSHTTALSQFPFASAMLDTLPLQELCWPLYPWFFLLFTNLLYRSIPAIGGNHKAAVLLTSAVMLALSVISIAVCGVFAQPISWIFRT